jgi:hypothetical protein
MRQPKLWLNKYVKCTSGLLVRSLRQSSGIQSIPQAFLSFNDLINFHISQGHALSRRVSSATSSSAWTPAFNRRLWFSSQQSCDVNWYSKKSAVEVAFSSGWDLRAKGPWIAVGAFGPSLFIKKRLHNRPHILTCDLTVPYFLPPTIF